MKINHFCMADSIQQFADLVVEYIFDEKNGMKSEPFYIVDEFTITLPILRSYYRFKFNKTIPNSLIPSWLTEFNLDITSEDESFLEVIDDSSFSGGQVCLHLFLDEDNIVMPDMIYQKLVEILEQCEIK